MSEIKMKIMNSNEKLKSVCSIDIDYVKTIYSESIQIHLSSKWWNSKEREAWACLVWYKAWLVVKEFQKIKSGVDQKLAPVMEINNIKFVSSTVKRFFFNI